VTQTPPEKRFYCTIGREIGRYFCSNGEGRLLPRRHFTLSRPDINERTQREQMCNIEGPVINGFHNSFHHLQFSLFAGA
jgi:hypothetical protein